MSAVADKLPVVTARRIHADSKNVALLVATCPFCGEDHCVAAHLMPLGDRDARIKARCSRYGKSFLLKEELR